MELFILWVKLQRRGSQIWLPKYVILLMTLVLFRRLGGMVFDSVVELLGIACRPLFVVDLGTVTWTERRLL